METLVTADDRRRAAFNTGLAKVAVQCSADIFVLNQSLVLRINICSENRHLRQARKRYGQGYETPQRKRTDKRTTEENFRHNLTLCSKTGIFKMETSDHLKKRGDTTKPHK